MVAKKPIQTNKAGYVTNGNHYRSRATDAVFWIVMCAILYFVGTVQGKTEGKYESSQLDLANQKKVYEADNEINSNIPNVRDTSEWAKWMKK